MKCDITSEVPVSFKEKFPLTRIRYSRLLIFFLSEIISITLFSLDAKNTSLELQTEFEPLQHTLAFFIFINIIFSSGEANF